MSYDTLADFTPVMMIGTSPNMLIVKADSPIKTMADFVRLSKASGQAPNCVTPAVGTTTHISAVMIERVTGLQMNHIPYKGMRPATPY